MGYGDLFTLDSETSCSLRLDCGREQAVLSFSLPATYPSQSPPSYSYSAPFLGPREKSELQAELDSVYLENIGEDILFLWVEKVNTIIKYLKGGKVSPQILFPSQLHDIVSISFFDTKSENLCRQESFLRSRKTAQTLKTL